MSKKAKETTLRSRCKFSLEDDDSGGPTGPDYLLLQLTPEKSRIVKKVVRRAELLKGHYHGFRFQACS
jgi:hypothetical protein